MPVKKKYTDKQKIAYYKKKALQGQGAYRVSRARNQAGALRGRGGYYDGKFVKTMNEIVPKGSFRAGGKMIGGPVGGIFGSLMSKLLGFGAYKVSSNSLMLGEGQDPPSMHSNDSVLRVRHREYVCDIVSSATPNTFNLQAFPIQPGLVQSFPWLSAIAQQYEEYVPRGIVYEFKTLSATAIASGTNSTMGGIIMATDYNSINGNFVNKQQMDNTEYTCSAPVYESFYHPVECDARQNPLANFYVRSGAVPTGTDQRMYDLGIFQVASFGVQGASVVLGELWISYEFDLRKPISTSALGQDVLTDHFHLNVVSAAAPLGTSSVIAASSSIGGAISSDGTSYSFPSVFQEGTYLILWVVLGNSTTSLTGPTFTYTNCVNLQVWADDSQFNTGTPTGTTSSRSFYAAIINITGPNASVHVSTNGTIPASITSGDLMITQWDYNIAT